MILEEEIAEIRKLLEAGLSTRSERELEEVRVRILGKKGRLTSLLRGLKDIPPAERSAAGKTLNIFKVDVEEKLSRAKSELHQKARENRLSQEWVDITLDLDRKEVGNLHPTSQIQYQIEDVFTAMGFEVLDGPHVETDYFNFEALNIPAHHPARDMQDTFYLEDGNLLRTHTSPIQVRGMQRLRPPFKVIGPGKVFRCERIDASHDATFHQLEGMMVDRDIKVAHLMYFGKELLRRIFQRDVEVRLRPGYFPFVEPGFELDIRCLICEGAGCSVCKTVGWVELMPSGMVHPNVLRFGGIDPQEYSGFAFGLGLDRLVQMRYQIDDIRLLHGADLRFLRQFS